MDESSAHRGPQSPPTGEAQASAPTRSPRLVPSSPRARRIRWLVVMLVVVALVVPAAGLWAYDTLPRRVDSQQTLVFGQTQFAPGREGALRLVVRDAGSSGPIPNADVKLSLVPKGGGRAVTLFRGRSDEEGTVGASFQVPASTQPTQTLVIETRSRTGRDLVKQDITVERSYKLLLATDKPVYQPGQTVHMRALAFSTLDMQAVQEAEIGFLVEDPKGNKVFRQAVTSSAFGVAAADFQLASEVINGDYKVSVSLGDTSSEKTVSVKPYVLPKFAVKVNTERAYYLPGQTVAGTVQCDYFFGKPVAEGQVEISGSVFDVQTTQVVNIQGRTDANGTYRFEFDLPQYFAGGGLEKDQAEFSLQVAVVDQAEHTEQTSKVLPMAQDPIVIEVVPEAGVLKPGVENRLYILTSYPDGKPAVTRLQLAIGDHSAQLATGEYGLAEYAFVPAGPTRLAVTARDERGQTAATAVELGLDAGPGVVLLRPDHATYRLGETMHLVALTSHNLGSIFLDIVKDGQTLLTRSAPVADGRAEFAVDLGGDLFGTLALHAYKVLLDGSIIRDTRLVVVDAPRDVATDIQVNRDVYRPGETARLSFATHTDAGPVQSALGVAIVDESVFAVMEQDPGFAKLYFLLRKELLEPRYQVKGFTLPEVLTSTRNLELQATQDQAVRAAWAPLPHGAMALNVDSRPLKIQAARSQRSTGLDRVANLTLVLAILVPLGLWATAIAGLHATGVLGRAAGRCGLTTLGLMMVGPFACAGVVVFLYLLSSLAYRGGNYRDWQLLVALVLVALVVAWLAAVAAVAIYAWLRRDERARIIWLLVVAWVGLGVVLTLTLGRQASPSRGLAIGAFVGYLGGLLALLLFGVGLYVEGRRWAGVSMCAIVLLFIPAMIAAASLPEVAAQAGLVRTLGNPAVYAGPASWLSGCAPAPGGRGMDLGPELLRDFSIFGKGQTAEMAPMPTRAPAAGELGAPEKPSGEEAPRVRQFFPETLLWAPDLETDAGGFVELDVPLADSITTWRITALASTQDGRLGLANAGLRVFQDFFVDIDLPVALTQNDEVAIPVAVYNYLPQAQDVRLEVAPESWFELQDERLKTLRIEANDIDVVYFRIRVVEFGEQAFQVTAYGEQMSDAIRRTVAVVPDGRRFRRSQSDWLRETTTVTASVPAEAIPGTAQLEVKIYPGVVSQVVEGLERILRLPHG